MSEKIIGILGGMGPEATANFFLKIIKATPVEKDQDHLRIIIDSNPKIPDRTSAILGHGPSPVETMVRTGKNLASLGVNIGAIPCITAHYFFDEVQKELPFPLVNALEELNKRIKTSYPHVEKIGVLATTGTVKSKLYDKHLSSYTIIYPDDSSQEKIMKAIYGINGIKNGNTGIYPKCLLVQAGFELIERGSQALIAGCTEIPLVLKPEDFPVPLLDPMEVLAESIVNMAKQSQH
ncbi:MAG: aspartate/glutamate racemase family protein [Bacillota bacterium]|uniref:Amino acid racemase n=1 Tax=Thermanaerosceptrum fracticalcis TaxID=1712410 RepID=A0A7G6E5F8_THEFR|nr:amino acid racemase [Thermanaerosceptrum fracticalcis]QNB47312.1 amino acid racemase [Thermanaerosceptrum fracticalcis]